MSAAPLVTLACQNGEHDRCTARACACSHHAPAFVWPPLGACAWCGHAFRATDARTIYCCKACAGAAACDAQRGPARVVKTDCRWCGALFNGDGRQRFCRPECRRQHERARDRRRKARAS